MFSKAKIKRFNEELSCAPPPTKYDPKLSEKCGGCYLDRSNRWKERKDASDLNPNLGPVLPGNIGSFKGKNSRSGSATFLNSSNCSSTSASSQSVFLSPPHQSFSRSRSLHAIKSKDGHVKLKEKVKLLQDEKTKMQLSFTRLEKELEELRVKEDKVSKKKTERILCDSSTQVDVEAEEKLVSEVASELEDLSCSKKKEERAVAAIPFEELELLRDQIEHLTVLRDNLEASVAVKEDTITDLQMQIDMIVSEAEDTEGLVNFFKQETNRTKKQLEKTLGDQETTELRVRELVAKYEVLMRRHEETCMATKDAIAQKDIEIELLNDSIATLNTQVSEYERTIHRVQSEVSLRKCQISSLQMTVGDLSIATKEKEFMETMLEDEIQEKNKEVSKLEVTLKDFEAKLRVLRDDREFLAGKLDLELTNSAELCSKLTSLEVTLKEKEVVQQFLEKELSVREAEVNESNEKILKLETELELTRKVAIDLQEEAEAKLNQVFCLQASLSAKDYDLESKDEIIVGLKQEVCHQSSRLELLSLADSAPNLTEEEEKIDKINALEESVFHLKSALCKEEEKASQLQDTVSQLRLQISEEESRYKEKVLEKEIELEDLSVKYSEALLEQQSTRRILGDTSAKLEKENLLLKATEREVEGLRNDLAQAKTDYADLESASKQLTHKLIHIEDALACEEAESREIQGKLESSEERLKITLQENEKITSANEGYAGQIAMLKVAMAKKSLAVEDMQKRIDELRDEKCVLTEEKRYFSEEKTLLSATLMLVEASLRDKEAILSDLKRELETRVHTIVNLQTVVEEKSVETELLTKRLEEKGKDERCRVLQFEEEKGDFFNQISLLENHLKEEQSQKAQYKAKAFEMEDKLNAVQEEKLKMDVGFQSQIKIEKVRADQLEKKLLLLERKYEGYEDQLINMQTSLMDKTVEAEKFSQSCLEANVTTESYKEKIEELKKDISRLVKESDQLSISLASKDTVLTSLNDSVSVKSDEIHNLHKNLEDKQTKLSSLEKRLQDMEKTLISLKEERDRANSRAISLQESLDLTREELMKMNTSAIKEELEAKLSELITEHEKQMTEVNGVNASLQTEAQQWKKKFDYLEKMIEPFREQLNAYEVEKFTLLSKSSAAEVEMKKLSDEYAKLLGHNNHKQKILHVVKLKTENNQLKERVLKLQSELEKKKKAILILEEEGVRHGLARGRSLVALKTTQPNRENKENVSFVPDDLLPQGASTPLRSSSLSNRYRRV